MTTPYIVKPGDTLLRIAVEQQVDFNTLLQLNPQYQPDPDLIQIGASLLLPQKSTDEPIEPEYPVEPVTDTRPLATQPTLIAPPLCTPIDVHDVLFFTGEGPLEYWSLDEKSTQLLEEEARQTDRLIDSYRALLESAPDQNTATRESLERYALKRAAWLEDAKHAGVFALETQTPSRASARASDVRARKPQTPPNQERIKAELKSLRDRHRFVEHYRDDWFGDSSVDTLRKEILTRIQLQIDFYSALETKTVQKESVVKMGVDLNRFNKTGREAATQRVRHHVREVYSVRQERALYVRDRFYEREVRRWRRSYQNTRAMNALEQRDFKRFGKAIAQDIKEDFKDRTLSPKFEAKLNSWQLEGWKYKEWTSTQPFLNEDGETQFAISAEAQLLRWGAQASVAASFEPSKGKVGIALGAEGSISLAEAKISADLFLPYENGLPVMLSYTDANKQPATYSFGCFRLKGTATIGCFVGGMAEASLQAGNQPEENGGSTGVMFTPSVNLSRAPKGDVGFKAQGFAGAQASGQLTGAMEWQPPKDINTTKFKTLAEIKTEGNIAAGAGLSADFQLSLLNGNFYVKCSGKLVWGVGGGGGFGAVINMDELWELAKVIWQGLQYVDYRALKNIDQQAYKYLVDSTIVAFASDVIQDPEQALLKAVQAGEAQIAEWKSIYEEMQNREKKAAELSRRIMNDATRSSVPLHRLPPEAIGAMLDLLVESFYFNWEEEQETAICKLLKESTYSWHKFEEILENMASEGRPNKAERVLFDNLARINAILDGEQQEEFNLWVAKLAETNKVADIAQAPYSPRSGAMLVMKRDLVKQQIAMLDRDAGTRCV